MLLLFFKQFFSFPFVCLFFFCRICGTNLGNEDSKFVVKYSSERAQSINQSFCIKQRQSCFCHASESQKVASNLFFDQKVL